MLDDPDDSVDDLAQVVGRDVRRHAHGDARRPVHEQVGERGRQDGRLFGALVVVRDEIDRLFVEVGHHLVGQRLQPRLRIAHRRRRISIDRSKVSLAVDQEIPHVEALREPNERVVNGRVAVRMEIPHHLADDLRALAVGAGRPEPHQPHAVQHATMRWLQPVAHIGQRAADDHAHRVIHVRAPHLVFDVDRDVRRGEGHGGTTRPDSSRPARCLR